MVGVLVEPGQADSPARFINVRDVAGGPSGDNDQDRRANRYQPTCQLQYVVSDSKAVRFVADFILKTGLLGQFREVRLDPEAAPHGSSNLALNA